MGKPVIPVRQPSASCHSVLEALENRDFDLRSSNFSTFSSLLSRFGDIYIVACCAPPTPVYFYGYIFFHKILPGWLLYENCNHPRIHFLFAFLLNLSIPLRFKQKLLFGFVQIFFLVF